MFDLNFDSLEITDPSIIELEDQFNKHKTSCESFVYLLKNKYHVDQPICIEIQKRCAEGLNSTINEQTPLISVVIPTYNRSAMLLESVKSVLDQTYPNKEIIVVDDCSKDDTETVMSQLIAQHNCVKYIRNTENKNAGQSRNIGYLQANGKYIVFLDDDDFYIDPRFFEKAIMRHIANSNLAFVAGNAEVYYVSSDRYESKRLNRTGFIGRNEFMSGFMRTIDKPLSTFSAVFDKEKLDKIGFKKMMMMNDASIYLRSFLVGDAEIIEDIIGIYRIHTTNISNRLSARFIIENLDEKVFIFENAKNSSLNFSDKSWLDDQFKSTISYWITSSKPSLKSIIELLRWNFKKNQVSKHNLTLLMLKKWVNTKLKS